MLPYSLPLQDLKISSDFINTLEPISFQGPISIIDSNDKVDHAIHTLIQENMIGFDTESRPSFVKGQKFPVSIIQLSTQDEAFIFQLKYIRNKEDIFSLLADANIAKVGVGVHDDIKRLNEMLRFKAANFIDLSSIAKSKGLIQSGAKALTARYLGRKLVKSSQKTNWAKKNLTDRQLEYAATDAWICLQILDPLKKDNTDYHALMQAELERLEMLKSADTEKDNS